MIELKELYYIKVYECFVLYGICIAAHSMELLFVIIYLYVS